MKSPRLHFRAFSGIALLAFWITTRAQDCNLRPEIKESSPKEISVYFAEQKKTILTFAGYSGAEYEDPTKMLERAARVLDTFDPTQTLVNIGATAEGIGAVYPLAKKKGFRTTGIVSTQAREQPAALSPCVDVVFYVPDSSWGGFLPGTQKLSPTSEAMVASSTVLVAIGGGEVARDEITAARQAGKPVRIFPADMHHQRARERALKKGQPVPTDFSGPVSVMADPAVPVKP